jgi:hypothetical protein
VNRSGKRWIKDALGELPLVPELYWQLRQPGKPISRSFTLRTVEKCLPEWNKQAQVARRRAEHGRKIFLFSTLRYWIEHATLTGVALAGQGHDVTLAYLPYANWHKPMSSFDLRRQNAYASSVFRNLEPLVRPLSLLDARLPGGNLPAVLEQAVAEVSLRDVQYTLQIEDVDRESELYRLRLERNRQAAAVVFHWLRANRPDVVVTPNGMILEMGSVYQAARYLDIPVVSYEFGEQRDRIWLAYNREVMRQDTDLLWLRYKDRPLTQEQSEQVRTLFASRQQARLWENFSRRWQGTPSQGGQQARQELGLDARPLVLLAANVIGDSLTLGRQVFSQSMTEWLTRTLDYFCGRPDVQLVVRIHPGERYTRGPSVADLLHTDRPDLPENIHLVAANDPVNTYDLVEIADLGLVYTTTVGMEMAMSGVPVIVAGQTHYRGRGFTQDPVSWEDYFQTLDLVLGDRERYSLTQAQVDQAWNYAYRFYFEYPLAFPWHLLKFGGELENWPVERVLSPEGQVAYGHAFHCLAGEPLVWPEEGKSILSADVSLSDPVEAMQPGQYLQESSP